MTAMDYRDDDERDKGWCPWCAKRATVVMVDGSGWCSEHGKVYLNWAPPRSEEDWGDVDDKAHK